MGILHILLSFVEDLMVFAIFAFIFGKSWYDKWLRHQERKMEIRLMAGTSPDLQDSVITELRKEIEQLRDTTTQYDVSIDHNLQDLNNRVRQLEARLSVARQSRESEEAATVRAI